MHTIEIDFEVFKALTARRETAAVTENDVIRGLLGLPRLSLPDSQSAQSAGSPPGEWVSKGVRFPAGTEFRANYKGVVHYGKVESGRLLIEGRRASSPSEGAKLITGTSVNGWTFWECRFPETSGWRLIKSLKNEH